MKKERFFELLGGLDEELLLRAEEIKPKRNVWVRWVAAAACFCLVVSGAVAAFMLRGDEPEPPIDPQPPTVDRNHVPIIFDATVAPDQLTGSPLEFLGGYTAGDSGISAEPPLFRFEISVASDMVVKAKVIENLPDIYYKLNISSEYLPEAYRMIKMETLEAIHGENVPQYFLYMLPEYLFVDMSVYDSLLITMEQIGTENYILRNGMQNKIDVFPLPVFKDCRGTPQLGNIIAFSDGIFDESLWQTESWIYGYQFASYYLDHAEDYLVVSRGGTERDAISKIKAEIDDQIERFGEEYKPLHLVTEDLSSEAAKAALDYVKPFENGVFSQHVSGSRLIYTRYINGCQTEETVIIDTETEEVTYSDVRYTGEDLSRLENIAVHIAEQAKAYETDLPTPPHTAPEGKDLLYLGLYGWYAKADGKVYGIVKTFWRYMEQGDWYTEYYDESFMLYDAVVGTAQTISREALIELVGVRNIYRGEYGEPIEMPYL